MTDPTENTRKAVILAAGRGTRMQKEAEGVELTPAQREMAGRGLKGLIPIDGHAFLEYVIGALADGGVREVCLVIGPATGAALREHLERTVSRVSLSFAEQPEPLGAANALLAAAEFAGEDAVLVVNSDNYYPAAAVRAVAALETSGLAGFRPGVLVERGRIPAERIAAYALVTTDEAMRLEEIVEKPSPEVARSLAGHSWVSMTLWRFRPAIFEACRRIGRSARGEYEIPDAVAYARRELGEEFVVVPVDEPVLDLSSRVDVPVVTDWLRSHGVRP
jgi:glucose-1-phosphate thymidylyltransferase